MHDQLLPRPSHPSMLSYRISLRSSNVGIYRKAPKVQTGGELKINPADRARGEAFPQPFKQ